MVWTRSKRFGKHKKGTAYNKKMAKTVKKIVNKTLNRRVETKQYYHKFVSEPCSGGANERGFAIFNLLSQITQGTDEFAERVGNEIYTTSLTGHLTFKLGAESEEAIVRCLILRDTDSNRNTDLSLVTELTTPTWGQLMTSENASFPYASDYGIWNVFIDRDRFDVLYDQLFTISAKTVEQGEGVDARSGLYKNLSIEIPLKDKVLYDESIAWPVKNDIYIMFLTDRYTTEIPDVSGIIRINYKDM